MSDCTNGGRRVYSVPTHSPSEDRLEITAHFKGDIFPRTFVINRLDREVDYMEVDGERYERVRECHVVNNSRKYVLSNGAELFDDGCSICNGYVGEGENYCSTCGAKVKVGE